MLGAEAIGPILQVVRLYSQRCVIDAVTHPETNQLLTVQFVAKAESAGRQCSEGQGPVDGNSFSIGTGEGGDPVIGEKAGWICHVRERANIVIKAGAICEYKSCIGHGSSPGPHSCGNTLGSYRHAEEQENDCGMHTCGFETNFTDQNAPTIGMKPAVFLIISVWISLPGFGQLRDSVELYANGAVRGKGKVLQGKKEGTWIFYYPDGTISGQEDFVRGLLHGTVLSNYPDGSRQSQETWLQGMLQDSAWYYHPGGALERKGLYHQGRYQGTWCYFYANGNPDRVVRYVEGFPEGEVLVYAETGVLIQHGYYTKGMEDGLWKFFDAEGRIQYEGNYQMGKRTGVWYTYTRKGQRKVWKYKD